MKMEMKKESYEKPSLTVVRLEASLPIMSSEIEGGATIDPTEPGENGSVTPIGPGYQPTTAAPTQEIGPGVP